MKKISLALVGSFLALTLGVCVGVSFDSKHADVEEVHGYSTSSLPTTIDLNDTSDSNIRSYYSSLNDLAENQRQGNNLLKNLKTILKTGQKYYSYDSGNAIWQIYEIADRDWTKSPASSTTYGTYNSSTNKITNYGYGSNSNSKNNPYIHALYINRDVNNQTTAWDDHQQTQWGINREHVWPKAEGFETSGQGGARGDPMHLMAGNGYANNIHSNYYYGYVDTDKSYTNCGSTYGNISGNLLGKSKTITSSNTNVFEPQDCDKGDIARAIFYMVARYNYLSSSDSDGIDSNNPNLALTQSLSDWASSGYSSTTSKQGKMGIMTDLLAWHHADPVDEYEKHRNNLLYTNYTNNRNPFIDFPEWADFIWGSVNYNGSTYVSNDTTPTGYATPSTDTINGYNGQSSDPISVTGVSIPETYKVSVGSEEMIYPTFTPSNATNKNCTWTSSDTSIAEIASSGRITAKAEGTTIITVTTSDGGFTDTCTLTVEAASEDDDGEATIAYNDTFNPTLPTASSDVHTESTLHTDETSGITFKEQGVYKGTSSGYMMFVQNKGFLYNTSSLGTIDSVSITYSGGVSTSAKIGVYFGSTEQSTYTTSGNQTIAGQSQTDTFNNSTDGNGFFQVSTSNKNCQITNIVVTYHESSTVVTLSSITVKTAPTKTTYTVGDGFNASGLVLEATYSDSSKSDISYEDREDEFEFDPADNLQTSDVEVTISWGGKSCTQAISVSAAKTLSSITLNTENVTKSFYVGDTFEHDNLVVTANFSDASNEVVSSSSTVSQPDMSSVGNKTITVSYTYGGTTKTAEYIISVVEGGSALPGDFTWNLTSESYDAASASQVSWTSDCATMVVDKYNATTNANNYLPPNYNSTRFYKDSKLTFTPNERYEITSVVYTATTSGYATAMKNSSWTNASATVSNTTVTITPTDGKAAFVGVVSANSGASSVVVNYLYTPEPTLSSITLDTSNVQTEFALNDTFNYSGLVVTAHYSDNTSSPISSGYTVSSPTMSTTGQKEVTVSYEEKEVEQTASYFITVSAIPTLSWTAPTINTYSGRTLTSSDTSSWAVSYNDGEGHITSLNYPQFTVKLNDTTISLPYTWQPEDDGKTLCVTYSTLTTATTTVSIVQSLQAINTEVPGQSYTSDLTFTAACGGSGTADDGKSWTVESDASESTFDNNKGIHYGTSKATVQYIVLSSTAFTSGKITSVVVNASTASGVSGATVAVSVGGSGFGGVAQSINTTATDYTFNGNADADRIEVQITKPSAAKNAIYCLSVKVTYSTSSTLQNIANVDGHEDAQRAVVKFAKAFNSALGATENCTTGLSSAWSTASSAWTTFLSEASALGSTEEAYAKSLIANATAQWTEGTDSDYSYCLERCLATYEKCVTKHGQTDFMSEVRTLSSAPIVLPIALTNFSNSTLIIVLISVLGLSAIGGYFYIRRKKEC